MVPPNSLNPTNPPTHAPLPPPLTAPVAKEVEMAPKLTPTSPPTLSPSLTATTGPVANVVVIAAPGPFWPISPPTPELIPALGALTAAVETALLTLPEFSPTRAPTSGTAAV